jgi:hypothetical protein
MHRLNCCNTPQTSLKYQLNMDLFLPRDLTHWHILRKSHFKGSSWVAYKVPFKVSVAPIMCLRLDLVVSPKLHIRNLKSQCGSFHKSAYGHGCSLHKTLSLILAPSSQCTITVPPATWSCQAIHDPGGLSWCILPFGWTHFPSPTGQCYPSGPPPWFVGRFLQPLHNICTPNGPTWHPHHSLWQNLQCVTSL